MDEDLRADLVAAGERFNAENAERLIDGASLIEFFIAMIEAYEASKTREKA